MLREFGEARIVVVDDEPAMIRLLDHALRTAGFGGDFVAIADPRELLRRWDALDADLVVLDIGLPHIHGREVLARIRQNTLDGGFRPVLVITGDDSDEIRREALSNGAYDFLTKPFHLWEAVIRVRNLLQARRLFLEYRELTTHLEQRVAQRTEELERVHLEMLDRLRHSRESRQQPSLLTRLLGLFR